MLKISYAGCRDLSPAMYEQFTLQICVVVWNRKKITKNPLFWISRSAKVIGVSTPGKLASSAC